MSDVYDKRSARLAARPANTDRIIGATPKILAVGEVALWKKAGRLLTETADIAFAEFEDISSDLVTLLAPDVIVSPLMTRSFDCLDIAEVLHECGFRGRYRIVSAALADPRILLSEIAAICPRLDVDVVQLDIDPPVPRH